MRWKACAAKTAWIHFIFKNCSKRAPRSTNAVICSCMFCRLRLLSLPWWHRVKDSKVTLYGDKAASGRCIKGKGFFFFLFFFLNVQCVLMFVQEKKEQKMALLCSPTLLPVLKARAASHLRKQPWKIKVQNKEAGTRKNEAETLLSRVEA